MMGCSDLATESLSPQRKTKENPCVFREPRDECTSPLHVHETVFRGSDCSASSSLRLSAVMDLFIERLPISG